MGVFLQMLTRFQLLENVGQFQSASSPANSPLRHYVLLYAENGRGKTTLSAIFHSLASNDPTKVVERRRLGSANAPQVVLAHDGTPPPFLFQNGVWNRNLPDLVIYDDHFVNENVYSGLNVEADHRQKLHELVIGANGVTLNRQLQDYVRQIETHNTEIRAREQAIPVRELGQYDVATFCDLPLELNVEAQIQNTDRLLTAARQQNSIQRTALFPEIGFPDFDITSVGHTLGQTLDALNTAAAAHVQEHFRSLGQGGEAWVRDGMGRVARAEPTNTCPFCVQDLGGSAVIEHYRVYFGNEYAALREAISVARNRLTLRHPRELPVRLQRAVAEARELRNFWQAFTEVPQVTFDLEAFIRDWQTSHDGLVGLLDAKSASPLEAITIPNALRDAIQSFRDGIATLRNINDGLRACNGQINAVKAEAAVSDAPQLERELARLQACQRRHSPAIAPLCDRYQAEKAAKVVTERLRDETRQQIEAHRAIAFPRYQTGINEYLLRFGVGFHLERVTPADTRGGATCNYDVVINNIPIPIAPGIVPQAAQPSFRNTLSAGDRNALALAFFFASLDQDPNLAQKIVVLDDPLSSLDEHRSFTTVQEVRRLGGRVAQLILLSHDKGFLARVWEGIRRDSTIYTPLKIQRAGQASVIEDWDVSADSVTEHDRNHQLLRDYIRNGPGADSRPVAVALRPLLEGFVRVAFPEHCPPQPRAFSNFMGICQQRLGTANEILIAQDYNELFELVEYGNRFHHETNGAWETEPINDAQLAAYVNRALDFASR
jgi:wobble nucleotide-excising tRNase